MNNNNFQETIIIPALELLKNNKIKKFYFLSGLLSIIFLTATLVYQVSYTYIVILGKTDKALELVLNFFHSWYAKEAIIIAIIFFRRRR